jgi:hypothetical protein
MRRNIISKISVNLLCVSAQLCVIAVTQSTQRIAELRKESKIFMCVITALFGRLFSFSLQINTINKLLTYDIF